MPTHRLNGLYAITDSSLVPAAALRTAVLAAIRGGARVIQYRDKGTDRDRRLAEAGMLAALCREQGVPLIVNDDVGLAAAISAQGVHLGRDDPAIGAARARLGSAALVGVSCYNRLDLAERAEAAGANYVAFGRFFPSRTKPDAVPASADLLSRARDRLRIPIVAIGGITPDNGRLLLDAGADMLAVIEGVFGQEDPRAAAARYAGLFGATRRQTNQPGGDHAHRPQTDEDRTANDPFTRPL